jgi:hypothetical protein
MPGRQMRAASILDADKSPSRIGALIDKDEGSMRSLHLFNERFAR